MASALSLFHGSYPDNKYASQFNEIMNKLKESNTLWNHNYVEIAAYSNKSKYAAEMDRRKKRM